MIRLLRSAPISTLSFEDSKSLIETNFWLWRAASSAASFTRLARSAPEKPGVAAREHREVDVVGERDLAGVDLQDALAAAHVGARDDHAPVEAAGPQQRRVEHVGPVGGGDQDDAVVRLEAVHLDQQLVQRLLALVVPAAEAGAAVAADGVDLVDEDDAGGVLLALLEEVAHAARRRRRRTSRRSRSRRSRRTARSPRRRSRGPAASCPCPAGPSAARPWGCGRRASGTSAARAGTR